MGVHCFRQGERLLIFSAKNRTHLSLPSGNNFNLFSKKHTRGNNALLQNNFKNPHPNQTGLVGLFYLWKAFPLPTFSIKIVFNLKLKIKINQPTNQTPKVFQSIKSLNFSSLRFSTIVRRGKNCSTLPHNTTLKKAKLESLKLCFLYGI